MFEFFDDFAPENEERISNKRADKIKASVLSRIEEDKPMKKLFRIKPLLIAAAVMTYGAVSAVSAGAAENTNISELTLPKIEAPAITNPNEEAKPDVTPEVSYEENDPELKTESAGGEMINPNIDRETFTKAALNFLSKYHELHKDDRKNDSLYEMFMGFNHLTGEVFYNTSSCDFSMLYEDSDGTRHYKTSDGKKVSVTPTAIGSEVRIYFLDDAVPEGDLSAITAAP